MYNLLVDVYSDIFVSGALKHINERQERTDTIFGKPIEELQVLGLVPMIMMQCIQVCVCEALPVNFCKFTCENSL